MNESTVEEPAAAAAEYNVEAEKCVSRNPATAILAAIGGGLLIALLVRALLPTPSPRQRLAGLLEDLEDRLRDAAEPAFRKANALAGDGTKAVNNGLHRGEAQLDRFVRDARRRVRQLIS